MNSPCSKSISSTDLLLLPTQRYELQQFFLSYPTSPPLPLATGFFSPTYKYAVKLSNLKIQQKTNSLSTLCLSILQLQPVAFLLVPFRAQFLERHGASTSLLPVIPNILHLGLCPHCASELALDELSSDFQPPKSNSQSQASLGGILWKHWIESSFIPEISFLLSETSDVTSVTGLHTERFSIYTFSVMSSTLVPLNTIYMVI